MRRKAWSTHIFILRSAYQRNNRTNCSAVRITTRTRAKSATTTLQQEELQYRRSLMSRRELTTATTLATTAGISTNTLISIICYRISLLAAFWRFVLRIWSKLRSFVVLSWCTLWHFSGEDLLTANQPLIHSKRNSSGDEIANVNFLYDDIVHVLQNTIDLCINSATDRRGGYVLEGMFTKFSEITQYNGYCAVQGHSRSPILVPIEKYNHTTV